MNNGGCSAHYPGVGDVRYARDLKSGQIVTRRFQCSRFGAHFHEKLGWVSKVILGHNKSKKNIKLQGETINTFKSRNSQISWELVKNKLTKSAQPYLGY